MEAATVEPEVAQDDEGAPIEGAEATREARHLFAYKRPVNVGAGAEECAHRDDGMCQDAEHFHAVVVIPNPLQHRDILEKARAARSRRKRAMRDAGDATRPASDAYVSLEADLDDLLIGGDRERIIGELAEREVRKAAVKRVAEIQEGDERWEDYWQNREEFERLYSMPEEERPAEEYETLKREMDDFEAAVDARIEADREREKGALRGMSAEQLREKLRTTRIDGEAAEAHLSAYYTWMAFVGTRQVPAAKKRAFDALEDYRGAAPEIVIEIEEAIRDLESRMQRGEAAGNS